MVLTADLRERDAEDSQNSSNSSDSEAKFYVVVVVNIVSGSSHCLSKKGR
jgi:hypothetical protein